MKVLHLPTPVGGNSFGLSRAERLLGLKSDCLVKGPLPYFNYPADRVVNPHSAQSKFDIRKQQLRLLLEFFRIRSKYDVFHFNFGQSLIDFPHFGPPLKELPFYPRKAKIFFTFNGCDIRNAPETTKRYEISACKPENCGNLSCFSLETATYRKALLDRIQQFADGIFSLNPDLLQFLPSRATFLPYTIANWDSITTEPLQVGIGPLRIAHAPTNRGIKGTQSLFAAVDDINKERPNAILLDCIEGLSHAEALKRYANSHLVVDQLRVGWYGALAVECMKMGKPVIAYIRDDDLGYIPRDMASDCKSAFIQANEHTIKDVLLNCIDNMPMLQNFANAASEYVNRWHTPRYVASLTKNAYENLSR